MKHDTMTDALRPERDALIEAMVGHVPFDGWTMACARTAAPAAGVTPEDVERLFSGGPIEMVEHYGDLADRRMLVELAQRDLPGMRIRDRITTAIRVRLQQHEADREAVRRAVALTAMPLYAATAARMLYRTVDAIWRVAGDTSTDFNFYTKRATLAWVYSATLLHWLDDESQGQEESWAFLERRIEDTMLIPKLRGRLQKAMQAVPNPMRAARAFRRGAAQFRGR